jgi:hypothetical protein
MINFTIILIAAGLVALVGSIPLSYANPVPSFVPAECQQYVDQPSTEHHLTVLSSAPYLPGSTIQLDAGTDGTGTGANRVRIVAVIDDTTVIYNNLQLLPNPYGSVSDSFVIPPGTTPQSSLDIYACFESPGSLTGNGVTHHLDVGSFFVVPESAIGSLALIGSSLAALGGYIHIRRFGTGIA